MAQSQMLYEVWTKGLGDLLLVTSDRAHAIQAVGPEDVFTERMWTTRESPTTRRIIPEDVLE
jgi:hypothetical protein